MQHSFSCSWDSQVWLLSVGVPLSILAVGLIGFIVPFVVKEKRLRRILLAIEGGTLAAVALLFAVIAAYGPLRYEVSADAIVVKRLGGDVTIPMSAVESVAVRGDEVFDGAVRLWASGGLFGYYGRFSSRGLGDFRVYATRVDKVVVLDTKPGGLFVLSPDDVGRFTGVVSGYVSEQAPSGA